jgi:hypothetical protein
MAPCEGTAHLSGVSLRGWDKYCSFLTAKMIPECIGLRKYCREAENEHTICSRLTAFAKGRAARCGGRKGGAASRRAYLQTVVEWVETPMHPMLH